jgi:hypothetical protein
MEQPGQVAVLVIGYDGRKEILAVVGLFKNVGRRVLRPG